MPSSQSDPLQPVDSRRLPGLDGMRALSIILVLFAHGWASIFPPNRVTTLASIFFANGDLGVTVFFVISGYLITYLLNRELMNTSTISLKRFFARRILRIFPALYTYLFVICVLSAVGLIQTTSGDIFRASAFLTNYGFLLHPRTNADYWFVGHFWSLSLEEQFYLFWPFVLVLTGARAAWKISLVIVCLSPPIRTVSYFIWPTSRGQLGMMLHCACDPIMMGCLAALLGNTGVLRKAASCQMAPFWALGAACFVAVPSAWLEYRFRGAYSVTVGTTLNAGCIAYCIMVVTRHPYSIAVRVLEWKLVRTIGVLSYSLYLWQQLFLGGAHWRWAFFPFNFSVCFMAALISHFAVERPFLRLRRRFSNRSRAASQSIPVRNLVLDRP